MSVGEQRDCCRPTGRRTECPTLLRMSSVSDCSSALSCIRDRWACSSRLVFTWGSLNLGLFSLWGTFWASCKKQTNKKRKVPFSSTDQDNE